mmetsp:Transcript_10626/g.47887  ORF Transcript_10626/g.47887 Transcript_10626/m.47887 type:complete len:330 (+) Transcript_10626:27-1016(+)
MQGLSSRRMKSWFSIDHSLAVDPPPARPSPTLSPPKRLETLVHLDGSLHHRRPVPTPLSSHPKLLEKRLVVHRARPQRLGSPATKPLHRPGVRPSQHVPLVHHVHPRRRRGYHARGLREPARQHGVPEDVPLAERSHLEEQPTESLASRLLRRRKRRRPRPGLDGRRPLRMDALSLSLSLSLGGGEEERSAEPALHVRHPALPREPRRSRRRRRAVVEIAILVVAAVPERHVRHRQARRRELFRGDGRGRPPRLMSPGTHGSRVRVVDRFAVTGVVVRSEPVLAVLVRVQPLVRQTRRRRGRAVPRAPRQLPGLPEQAPRPATRHPRAS